MYCTIYVLAAGLMVVQVKHISQISNINILAVKHEKNLKYTNSLVNADSFCTNFTNTTFQKNSHSSLNTSYETEIPSVKIIFFSFY